MTAENIDNILIFKTNLATQADFDRAAVLLNQHLGHSQWSVDMEDVDRVLRIPYSTLSVNEIVVLLAKENISCSEL